MVTFPQDFFTSLREYVMMSDHSGSIEEDRRTMFACLHVCTTPPLQDGAYPDGTEQEH